MTVFFTLVFLLIFAMVGTMVELARTKVTMVHSERTLELATESLFTEYNRPFYDMYGLFFLEDAGKPFEQSIGDYATATLNAGGGNYVDLFDGTLSEVEIEQKVYAGDKKGQYLAQEITDYMKRSVTKDVMSKFLKSIGKTGASGKTASDMEEKMDAEEEGSKLDDNMKKLMKLVDGVEVEEGRIKTSETFCKMFLTQEKASCAAITNSKVWEKVKARIVPMKKVWDNWDSKKATFMKQVKDAFQKTGEAIKVVRQMKKDYSATSKKSADLKDYYKRMDRCLGNDNWLNVLLGNEEVLKKVKNENDVEKIKDLWRDYNTTGICFDYTGVTEKGGAKNPRKGLSSLLGKGILNLVVKEPKKLSEKKISRPRNYEKLYADDGKESDEEKSVDKFAKDEKMEFSSVLGSVANYGLSEFCMDQYIRKYCGAFGMTQRDKVLNYEREYIIAGKEKDTDNLKSIANRLLLLRSVVNTGTIIATKSNRTKAYTAALGVVGFTGMEPLIRFTQSVILLTWGMEESMVDIAALFKGYKVPVVKTNKQIQVNFADLPTMGHSKIQSKSEHWKKQKGVSLGYDDYLTIFMMTMSSATKRYRLMDLMEANMHKQKHENFKLGNCVYGIVVRGGFTYPTKYLSLPSVQQMLGRKIYENETSVQVKHQYS